MGFGSYDETEQENQQTTADFADEEAEQEAEELNKGHHNGDVTFETDDVDSLLETFKKIENEDD